MKSDKLQEDKVSSEELDCNSLIESVIDSLKNYTCPTDEQIEEMICSLKITREQDQEEWKDINLSWKEKKQSFDCF